MKILLFSCLFLVAVVLGGCIPKVPTGPTTGSREYVKGKVVLGFPPLPLYEKAQILESYGLQGNYGAAYLTRDSLANVVKFYEAGLKQLGWQTSFSQKSVNYFVFEIKNDENRGEVIINTASDSLQTAISMWVESR